MKIPFKIFIIILFSACSLACSLQTEKSKEQNSVQIKKSVSNYVDLSDEHLGFWVYVSYFEALQKTKSTKKASEMKLDDFYRISKDNSIMRMNIHEGGAENIILMTTKNKGQIFSSDTTEFFSNVEFTDEFMIIDGKKYIKAPNKENGFNELVNSAFISGKYRIDGIEIDFKVNGTIKGVDSLLSYELNLDYNDAGMQYDIIYLKNRMTKDLKPFVYELKSDTLLISEIECKTFEDDLCVEIEKGKTVYKLIKK